MMHIRLDFPKYQEVNALEIVRNNKGVFRRAVAKILQFEAPLSEEYLLKRIVEFVTGRSIKDINSGLRVFDKSTVVKFFPNLGVPSPS